MSASMRKLTDVMKELAVPPSVDAYCASGDDPPTSSGWMFLWWLLKRQRAYLCLSVPFGLMWFLPGALSPYLLGQVIDEGVIPGDWKALLKWASLLTIVILTGVFSGIVMHTVAVYGWIQAAYRVMHLVGLKTAQLGHVQARRTPTGELLSISSSDAEAFGAFTEIVGRALAALTVYLVVAVIVLNQSASLGLAVLIAAPLIVGVTGPLMRPLQTAREVARSRSSRLTGMATDIVAGLRILRGIGGERMFGGNYAAQSQRVRAAEVRADIWFAVVDSLSGLLTGLLLIVLTYLGAVELAEGRLEVGQLVAFFGYAVFLLHPMRTFFEFIFKVVATLVSADKTSAALAQTPPWSDQSHGRLSTDAPIVDVVSGFTGRPGRLSMIVSAQPDDSAAVADRLGRYLPQSAEAAAEKPEPERGRQARQARVVKRLVRAEQAARDEDLARGHWGVQVGGVDLSEVPLAQVRQHILVSDAAATLFNSTLQEALDPHRRSSRAQAEAALWAASAEDILEGLPGGWQGHLDERGRALSGGQRQRVILARALLADPEILVLVEPTSAVDAHTEARIASRLTDARRGRTTIVTTASPLLLRQADEVSLLAGGKVVATGTHAELFATNADYRRIVRRGLEADE